MIWLILLLAITFRIINLNQSLWLDEAAQLILSSKSIPEIIYNRAADFHPPLSYLLYHFWLKLGTSEAWLRLLPAIFGVGTIAMLYILVSKIFNKNIALLSALLLSISPYHIYYSQEVRMYSLAALLTTLSMYFFYQTINYPKLINISGFVISTALLLYTHYLGLFIILSQFLLILFFHKEKVKQFVFSLIIIFFLYTPWLPQLFKQLKGGSNIDIYLPGWKEVLSLSPIKAIPLTLFKFSAGRIDFDNTYLYIIIASVVLSVFGFLLLRGIKRELRTNSYFVIFWFFVPLILAFIVSFQIPLNQPFRLLLILPAFYILISLGIDSLSRMKGVFMTLVVTVSLLGLSLYYLNPRFYREDWIGAVKYINSNASKNVGVIFVWPEPFAPFIWYGSNIQTYSMNGKMPYKKNDVETSLKLALKLNELYLFEYLQPLSDPNKNVQMILEENSFFQSGIKDFNGVGFIYKYSKND